MASSLDEKMIKVNFITSWNTECGIADTTRLLIDELEKHGDIETNIFPVKKYGNQNLLYFFKLLKNIPKAQITHIQYQSNLFSPFISGFSLGYFPMIIVLLKFWRKNKIVTTVHEIDSNSAVDKFIIKFMNLSDRLITHNPKLIKSMEEKGVKKHKCSLIHLGTLKSRPMDKKLCKKKLGLSSKKILTIFGFIGLNKGHDLAIDILSALDEDHTLIIAGESRTEDQIEYEQILKDKITSSKLEDRVKFLGFVDIKQLAVVANATDVFLYPYRWIVASAALNVALGYCIPTITSDLDYFREIKKDYDCIELFKSENRQDLLKKVNALLNSTEKQEYLRNRCRRFINATNWKYTADKTRKLYLNLIN